MDLLTHVFLPLILLAAIGRLKAKYTPLVLLSIFPDFDKLFFILKERLSMATKFP
jgi:hypothetical protein